MTETPAIFSLQNPAVRYVVRLRDNRFRRRERLLVVDGVREITKALDRNLTLKSMFVGPEESPEIIELANRGGAATIRVTPSVLEKIAFGEHHRDAVAVFEQPDTSLSRIRLGTLPLVLILDSIEKPGNVGAMFRSADAIGADGVVLCEGVCDLFNPSVIRASLGTVFTVPCAQADRPTTLRWLKDYGLQAITARVDAQSTLWEVDFRRAVAIVVGSEANGLGEQWSFSSDSASLSAPEAVRIPMNGTADSLNASVSAALLMFEALRQRLTPSSS